MRKCEVITEHLTMGVVTEQSSGKTWILHPDRIYKLGRNPDQDIRFNVSSVSRAHAELFWDGQAWCLRDCQSTYGTYIQNRQIQQQRLQPYDSFRLGVEPGVLLQFQPDNKLGLELLSEDGETGRRGDGETGRRGNYLCYSSTTVLSPCAADTAFLSRRFSRSCSGARKPQKLR